ncbi:hypothetical protein [Streptomyces synnematoformans]|uniref:Uncharacterized protein n=1 Tax=Streptomyces synnematoformans TaxID=415721 RepID=A0ABP5JUS1_9ACTN
MLDNWTNVAVSHHQFGVLDSDTIDIETADSSNGLILIMSHGAMISTGIHTGYVRVQSLPLPGPPSHPDDGPWEDIIEASVYSATGRLGVDAMEPSPEDDAYLHLPELATAGPGWYRLRAHARGRDTPHAAVQHEPLEDYLLLCWPAPQAPTTLIRTTDHVGHTRRAAATPHPRHHTPTGRSAAPTDEPQPKPTTYPHE